MLHHALGAVHGAEFLRAGDGVEGRLLGALVGKDKADVGFIAADRGDAGVNIHIIIGRDIVVAFGSDGHVLLTEHGIQEPILIGAVIIILIHDDIGGVYPVHPGGNVGIVFAFAGDGIDQHRALNIRAAEQPDAFDDAGADPIGRSLLVDLEGRLIKQEGRVLEPQVAVQVAAEMLGGGIAHPFGQAHHLHLLRYHIDNEVGRQAVAAVVEPFEDIAVFQRGHADGAAVVIDLGIVFGNLKLADHIGQLAQLAVPQLFRRIAVQHGDLIKGDLLNILGKAARFHRHQAGVGAGTQDHAGKQPADDINDKHGGNDQ